MAGTRIKEKKDEIKDDQAIAALLQEQEDFNQEDKEEKKDGPQATQKLNKKPCDLYKKIASSAGESKFPFIKRIDRDVISNTFLPLLNLESDLKMMSTFSKLNKKDPSSQLVRERLRQIRLNDLLRHIVQGNQVEAEKLIKLSPELLSMRGQVTDYSGRIIEGTPFQLALGAEDDEMCEMIAPYFDKIANGKEEKAKQYKEQFPDDHKKEQSYDFTALVNAIARSNSDADCKDALAKFREELKPKGIIKHGKHFNIKILIDAFKAYEANYVRFGGKTTLGSLFSDNDQSRKNSLFLREVIGYIQRFLPACYAQAFCQGLDSIVERGEKLQRKLTFTTGETYYPLDSIPNFRLGYEYAVGTRGKGPTVHISPAGLMASSSQGRLEKLRQMKKSVIRRFKPSGQNCVIM